MAFEISGSRYIRRSGEKEEGEVELLVPLLQETMTKLAVVRADPPLGHVRILGLSLRTKQWEEIDDPWQYDWAIRNALGKAGRELREIRTTLAQILGVDWGDRHAA